VSRSTDSGLTSKRDINGERAGQDDRERWSGVSAAEEARVRPCAAIDLADRIFHVRDFAAVADETTDSGDAIRAAIAAAVAATGTAEAPVEVVLDAGNYRVRHDNQRRGYCFPVHQAAHLTVRGAGPATKIVIADPTLGGFHFGMGNQVTLRDLVIDYDPLPFCQGTIRAVDVEQCAFDLEVAAGYPTPDAENFVKAHEPYGKWGMIMDPATRRIRARTPDHYMTPRWDGSVPAQHLGQREFKQHPLLVESGRRDSRLGHQIHQMVGSPAPCPS
jgi:hypothetical protein